MLNSYDLPPYIDLHTHSTASDGSDTPSALVQKASDKGLAAIALTDHDTLGGLKEAQEAARDLNIRFIRGCEISTSTPEGSIHMLGLWLPDSCPALEGFLTHLMECRRQRNQKMVKLMQAAGLDITLEEIDAVAGHAPGRPHMAQILVKKGYVQSTEEAFEKWLDHNGRAYVPKLAPRPEQAVRILREHGASAIIAHPLLRPKPPGWLDSLVRNLKKEGLFGLEAWHSAQSAAQSDEIIGLAHKYDLALSGGSDYHGTKKKYIDLGTGMGQLKIGLKVLEDLESRRKAQGLPC